MRADDSSLRSDVIYRCSGHSPTSYLDRLNLARLKQCLLTGQAECPNGENDLQYRKAEGAELRVGGSERLWRLLFAWQFVKPFLEAGMADAGGMEKFGVAAFGT